MLNNIYNRFVISISVNASIARDSWHVVVRVGGVPVRILHPLDQCHGKILICTGTSETQ
jgi:hypothetical protein